jgi:hypothetical protein
MSTGSFFTQREIHAKRAPERGHWESEAICSNADPSLFEFNEADPEGSASLIETGIDTYCQFCPVSDECLINATDEDKTWTVRGGQKPTLLTLGPIGGEEVDGFKRGRWWSVHHHRSREAFRGVRLQERALSGEGKDHLPQERKAGHHLPRLQEGLREQA